MHKKLVSDLTSLAHSILQMKNKDDVFALKDKAHEVYEKLALLAYVEEYINTTPSASVTKSELIATISEIEEQKLKVDKNNSEANTGDIIVPLINKNNTIEETEESNLLTNIDSETSNTVVLELNEIKEEPTVDEPIVDNEITEQPFDELENILFSDPSFKNEASFIEGLKTHSFSEKEELTENTVPQETIKEITTNKEELDVVEETQTPTLEDELADTISVDIMANLFEKKEPKRTLNDRLQNTIQIDLNDRIAFVKNLFEGDQKDFNRVISQLNTTKTEKEAKDFILKMVKPDYDWSNKEHFENRLLEIIERRFT